MATFQEEIELATFSSAVNSIIKNTCIIDFGVIIKVLGKGVVKVGISVAKNPSDIQIVTCTLLSTVSQSVSIDIEPQEGDKVLVLYPRKYKEDMFKLSKNDVIIDNNSFGYSPVGAVAILCNMFNENDYEKNIKINKDGEVELNLNDINITTSKDNDITVDNGKATVTIDKDGNVEVNAKGGKISLKNNSQSLFSILDGLIDKLNGGTVSTSGSPAKQLIDPAQFTTYKTNLGSLMQ